MAHETLKTLITNNIKTNGQNAITAQILQDVLIAMVDDYPDLSGYATRTWVQQQGYITASALSGYATQSWVASQLAGYATTSQLAGYLPLTGGTLTGALTVNSDIVGYNIQSDGIITAGGDVTATGFIKRGGQANQFLKADGSVDSNSYALASSLSNYLPLSGGTLTGNLDLGGNTLEMAIGDYSSSLNGSSLTFAHTEGQASIGLSTVDKFLSLTGTKILLNGVDSSTYITASALSGYATQSWVQQQGYITASALSDYATQSWVQQQGYITASALSGYATQSWVQQQGYVTASALSGYATQAWVNTQLADYLPLTGGTLTGVVNFTNTYGGGSIFVDNIDFDLNITASNSIYLNADRGVGVNGNIISESFIKNGGTSDQVLCADGSVKTLSELKAALDAL